MQVITPVQPEQAKEVPADKAQGGSAGSLQSLAPILENVAVHPDDMKCAPRSVCRRALPGYVR